MGSPLLEYSNSSIVITEDENEPQIEDGRYVLGVSGIRYLVKCYLFRTQASKTGTSIGEASGYNGPGTGNLSGIGLSRFLYRGYCLQYSIIDSSFEHGVSSESNLMYTDIGSIVPEFLNNDMGVRSISIRHGKQLISDGYIEIVGGIYGSVSIDEIIYENVGGVPITMRGSSQG